MCGCEQNGQHFSTFSKGREEDCGLSLNDQEIYAKTIKLFPLDFYA